MAHKKKKKRPALTPSPIKWASSTPEARDEGPRLVPLNEHPLIPKEVQDLNARYIALADQMLGKKKR